MNSADKTAEAKSLKKALEANGIQVICSGTSNSTHSQFISHSNYVTIDYYSDLKKRSAGKLNPDSLFMNRVTLCVQVQILPSFSQVKNK